MAGGHPRMFDRDQIAKDMIKWSMLPNSINVNAFCADYPTPFSPKRLFDWSKEETFAESYEIVKAKLAARREEWVSDKRLHVKAFEIAQYAYDAVIRQDRNDYAAYQASLKIEEMKLVNPEEKERFDQFIKTFRELQKKD